MEMDVATLRWGKIEDLQRLARAIQVPLPPFKTGVDREEWRLVAAKRIAAALAKSTVSR
jgi:hypothetical protein